MYYELRKLRISEEEIVENKFKFETICRLIKKGIVYDLKYENNIYGSFVSVYLYFREIPNKGWKFWGLGYDEYFEEWKDDFSVTEDDFFEIKLIDSELLDKEDVVEYLSSILKRVRTDKKSIQKEKRYFQRDIPSVPCLYEEYEKDNDNE